MKKEHLRQKIEEKECQIQQFKMRLETSDLCEDLYNKAILEKAILKKELDDMQDKYEQKISGLQTENNLLKEDLSSLKDTLAKLQQQIASPQK